MLNSVRKKICYVLPEYAQDQHTHFVYQYELLKKASNKLDIFLIIERGVRPVDFSIFKKVYVLKSGNLFFRFFEEVFVLKMARFLGYRDFYVHYSFSAAFVASLVVKVFGGHVFYWNCGMPWNYKKNTVRIIFEKFTYWLVDYLVTGTETMKNLYADNFSINKSKIKILPNWIDLKNVKKLSDDERLAIKNSLNLAGKKIVLFVHRLSRRKGSSYLVDIARGLSDEAVLLIVGDGPDRLTVEKEIVSNGLADKVKFVGWQSQSDLYKFYNIADLFILPSEEEGFPHVLLEAMAHSLPFVAFDVGGVKDIVPTEFSKTVVPLGDVSLFNKKISELLSGHFNVEQLALIFQNNLARFDIDKVLGQFINLFI